MKKIFVYCKSTGKVVEKKEVSAGGYQPFKPYWEDNFGPQPIYIDSLRTLEREMTARNLEPVAREHIDDVNERRTRIGLPPIRE